MVGLFVLASDEFNGLPLAVIANWVCAKASSVQATVQPGVTERFRAREEATKAARHCAAGEERFHAEAMTDARRVAEASCRAMAKDRPCESRAAELIRAAPVAVAEDRSVAALPRFSFHRARAIRCAMAWRSHCRAQAYRDHDPSNARLAP